MKIKFAIFLLPLACLASITSQTDKIGPFLITSSPQTIPVGFPFQQASDLLVLDIGPTSAPHDPAITLTINSDYTVIGGGYNPSVQMQTGSVTVSTGGVNNVQTNDNIIIMRNVPINQITYFSATGPLTISLLEQALDKEATLSQQINEIGSRSLQFENFESLSPSLIKAARANNLLGFAADGSLVYYPLSYVPTGTIPGNSVQTISTLRALSVSSYTTGSPIFVLGYYTAGDQAGSREYDYNAASTTPDNGGTVIAPNVGAGRWILNTHNHLVSVLDFGAYGDNSHNDYAAIAADIAATGNYGEVYFPSGIYLIGSTLTVTDTVAAPRALRFIGDSYKSTYLFHTGAETTGCMQWIGQPINNGGAGGDYIASVTGSHYMENITLGSLNGPCLTMNWCTWARLKDVLWASAGASYPNLLIENSNQLRFENLGDANGNQSLPSGITLPGSTYGTNDYLITTTSYTGAYTLPGVTEEIFFFGCRTDSQYTQHGIVIQPYQATGGAPNLIGRVSFVGCKLSGPNGNYAVKYGALYVNGCKQVNLSGGTFIEGAGATTSIITLNNSLGACQLTMNGVEDFSDGIVDVGIFGGSTSSNLMHLDMQSCRFGAIRANYNAASSYGSITVKDCKFITSPESGSPAPFTSFNTYAGTFTAENNQTIIYPLGATTALADFIPSNVQWTSTSQQSSMVNVMNIGPMTVAGILAITPSPGLRGFATNSSQTTASNPGAILSASTGSNQVPVYADGTNWRIE